MSTRTSEIDKVAQIAKVKKRADDAIICNGEMPRGRCNKFIATREGEVRCSNGHLVSARDIVSQNFKNSIESGRGETYLITPRDEELRMLVNYFVTPEMLENDSSQLSLMTTFYPGLLYQIVSAAETMRPDAARTLKKYLERKIAHSHYPLLGQYLDLLKNTSHGKYLIFREKMIRCYASWDIHSPTRYLSWSEIMLEAATGLKDSTAKLYEHNISEAGDWLGGTRDIPIYFYRKMIYPDEVDLYFTIMVDPRWKNDEARKGFYGPEQLAFAFNFNVKYQNIKWFGAHHASDLFEKKLGEFIDKRFQEQFSQKEYINFVETSKHISPMFSEIAKEDFKNLTQEDYALKIMNEIRIKIGNCGLGR
jgi:hypothetical protein